MDSNLLASTCVLFASLFAILTMACLPLYKWDVRTFFSSKLWVKIYWWVPIFSCLLLVGWLGFWAAAIVYVLLLYFAFREFRANHARGLIVGLYALLVGAALLSLPLMFWQQSTTTVTPLLVALCFMSVLSDVAAFFGGRYLGKHPLPAWINNHKYWEGAAGQIFGAILGALLVALLPRISLDLTLGLVVGVGSAAGDLYNSIAKRILSIKDWGTTIPGHGGVLDRFSSLSLALLLGYITTLAVN